jgi:5-methylcytosine-specific restriction endonuclease McrA
VNISARDKPDCTTDCTPHHQPPEWLLDRLRIPNLHGEYRSQPTFCHYCLKVKVLRAFYQLSPWLEPSPVCRLCLVAARHRHAHTLWWARHERRRSWLKQKRELHARILASIAAKQKQVAAADARARRAAVQAERDAWTPEQWRTFQKHKDDARLRRQFGWGTGRRSFTAKERAFIVETFNRTCAHCGKKSTSDKIGPRGKPWHIDHVMPVSQGGTNYLNNLVLSCARCNLSKHARTDMKVPTPITMNRRAFNAWIPNE